MELPWIGIIRNLIKTVRTFLYFSWLNIFNIIMKRMLYLSLVQLLIDNQLLIMALFLGTRILYLLCYFFKKYFNTCN